MVDTDWISRQLYLELGGLVPHPRVGKREEAS